MMKFSTFLQIYLIVLVTILGYGVFWAIRKNTNAICEQTKVLGRVNLIQASERIEGIVVFQQEGKDILKGNAHD